MTLRPASIHRIVLKVDDLATCRSFYADTWGLIDEGPVGGYIAMRSPGANHCDLFLRSAAEPGMDSIGFALRSPDDMAEMIRSACGQGAELLRAPGADPLGETSSALVRAPDGISIEFIVPAPPSREPDAGAEPRKVGHVVLWSRDRTAAEIFYSNLGFKIADRTALGMSFLRCNHDHHSLALVDGATDGLQHLAFEVSSVDQVMISRGRLERGGTKCIWGVGRHGPGRTIFSYYLDPAGNTIEYFSDVEQFEDNDEPIVPRYWSIEHKGDAWGVAGPSPFAPV